MAEGQRLVQPPPAGATRALVPLGLDMPRAGLLEFRVASERFTRDACFRLVYYFPADPATMRWCAGADERGGPHPRPFTTTPAAS